MRTTVPRSKGSVPGRGSQLTGGHAQQHGGHQQEGAGGRGPGAVSAVVSVAVALVGSVAVVCEATLHLCSRAAAVGLVTESLVRARLHHGVWR